MIYFSNTGEKSFISHFSLDFLNLEKSNYVVIAFGGGFKNAIFYVKNRKKRINKFLLISPLGFESSARGLNLLMQKGIDIEIYVGDKDINVKKIINFFREHGVIYIIRNKNYILEYAIF